MTSTSRKQSVRKSLCASLVMAGSLVATSAPGMVAIAQSPAAKDPAQSAAATQTPGTPFSADKLSSLLPPSVYFAGQTAPLQLRNAGGTRFTDGAILWISLVDSSGYSSNVQQRYQFYLVTEGPLRFGDVSLRPGAYGGGFVGDRFVLMDVGDHSVGEGPTQNDSELKRPRPLQIVAAQADSVKLYLGRRWVMLRADRK